MEILADKIVVLTGASGGIGSFIARALAKEHATVVCIARSKTELDKISAEINTLGGRGISISCDISNLEALPDLVAQINNIVGPIDVLINNAAIERFRPFQAYTLKDIQEIGITNLLAPMELCRLFLPDMLSRQSGHIVNISSGAGKRGAPFNSIYSATKAGLINWSEALRLELASNKIGISVVCPGVTDAGMFHVLDIEARESLRVTPPAEVANVVLQAIKQNHKEVILDGLTHRIFYAISQLSPPLGDAILQRAGVVETNQHFAQKQMQAEKQTEHLIHNS
jgi:short-subunit dehydrogenase